jgi:hypothetical protein
MPHPSHPPGSSQPLRPSPTVTVGAPDELQRPPASVSTEDSGAHHAHRFGFGLSDEGTQTAGLPAERRPLTHRGIRNWTIGSLIGAGLLASVVAVASLRSNTHDPRTVRTELRPDVPGAQPAAARPAALSLTAAIPLEALPIATTDLAKTVRPYPKKTTHQAAFPRTALVAKPLNARPPTKPSPQSLAPGRAATATAKTAIPSKTKPVSAR